MVQNQGGFEPMTIWPLYEKKKMLAEGGFDPQISGRECKMLPLSHQDFLWKWHQYNILIYQPNLANILVWANFSQLPPFCAIFHIDTIKPYLISHLFLLYDMSEPGWALFPNQPFGSYFLNPWTNWKNPCRGSIYFVLYINQHHRFFCTLAKSLGNFSLWAKNGHLVKILRWFSVLDIDRHS